MLISSTIHLNVLHATGVVLVVKEITKSKIQLKNSLKNLWYINLSQGEAYESNSSYRHNFIE